MTDGRRRETPVCRRIVRVTAYPLLRYKGIVHQNHHPWVSAFCCFLKDRHRFRKPVLVMRKPIVCTSLGRQPRTTFGNRLYRFNYPVE
jgi:hypothetical protein